MLLVKSKELKNSNKKHSLNPCLASLPFIFLSFVSAPLQAQEETQSLSSVSSILSVFLSLLVVIAIILALAFIMRRFNVAQAGNGQMRVVASMMAGNKEKIMVIEVGNEQHLLGITAHNINHLATLNEPLSIKQNSSLATQGNNGKMNFQQKLVNAMAQNISSAVDKRKQKSSKNNNKHEDE